MSDKTKTLTIVERLSRGDVLQGVVTAVEDFTENLDAKERHLNTCILTVKVGDEEITEKVALTSSEVPEVGNTYSFAVGSQLNPEGLPRAVHLG
jgi:hypothetical protein